MKRKLFSAILFGALLTASTSGLTSCKDYDDDISNLQSQIDKLATADQLSAKVSELQAAIAAAQSAAESKAAAAQTVADAAKSAAADAAAAASKAQGAADEAAKAAAAAAEVGKAAQAAVDKLAGEAATKAELEAAKDAAAAAVAQIVADHAADKAAIEASIETAKSDLLAKINANTEALAALDTRLTAVEAQLKAIIDGEGGETSLEAIAAEVEAIGDALEDLIGAFTMATSIDIYTGVDGYDNALNFWKVKEAVTAEFPREANAKEADGEAYVFKTGTERVYEDSVLVRVNPVDATLDADHIVLLNSQGAEISSDLVECVEARAFESSNPLVTRAAGNGTGLWVVKFKATDKLISDKDVQKEFKAATELGTKKILFALGTDESYEAADVDRRLVTEYALTMGCDDAKRASEFKVNDIAVAQIRNRFKTSEDGVQVPKDVYGIDYKWRYIDEDEDKNPVVNDENTIIPYSNDHKNDYNVVDDNRQDAGQEVLVAEVGQSITISFPTSKPIKGFYVTLDYKRAIESAASEINAWNTYEYENVAKINKKGEVIEAATLQNGNVGYIQVNDLKDYASVGDVIGFRVFAVNLDGTLVDPDGQAFYVGFGESEEVADEKEIDGQTIEVKYAAGADKKNITDFIDVEDAFGGVTFDRIAWTASKGADEVAPSVGNTSGNIRITYYKEDKKTAIKESEFGSDGKFWEDVKYIKAEIAEPTYLVDGATYTLTATLGVKVGNSSYKVRTVTMPLTKKMPTSMPDGYGIKFETLQGAEQVVTPNNDIATMGLDDIANGAFRPWGVWVNYADTDNARDLKNVYGVREPGKGSINLNNIYRFEDGKYIKDRTDVSYVVRAAKAGTKDDGAADLDVNNNVAVIAGNFINGGSYSVVAGYTYKDISRRPLAKNGTDWRTGDKLWSAYADGTDNTVVGSSETNGSFDSNDTYTASNDFTAKVALPSINLMPWSKLADDYLTVAWSKKCVSVTKKDGKVVAGSEIWIDNNEALIAAAAGNAQKVHISNIQALLGSKIKNMTALAGVEDADDLANTKSYITFNKTNDTQKFNEKVNTERLNIWTETADGSVNPYYMVKMISDNELQFVQLKDKEHTPAHSANLCMEIVDHFGYKQVVKLPVKFVNELTPAVQATTGNAAVTQDGLSSNINYTSSPAYKRK